MMLGIVATTYFPLLMGQITNRLAVKPASAIAIGLTLALVGAYVVARILMQAFGQLRDGIFAKVLYHAMREVAVQTFAHIHTLSLRFHLERKTGGLSRVIDRGIKGIDTLLSFALFSIFPTIFQLLLFSIYMVVKLDWAIAIVTLVMVVVYTWFTFADHPLARRLPPRNEPVRHRRQHQGGGQSAQFRDGEIFQQ